MVYQSLLEAMPKQSVIDFVKIHDSNDKVGHISSADTSQAKQMASTMKTLEDLRMVLVKMITGAKTLDPEYSLRDEIYAISDGLCEFKWEDIEVGTDISYFKIYR